MKRGFTLIELLAGMVVFMLIAVAGVSLIGSVSNISRSSMQQLSLREDARSVFDRMAIDFSTTVRFDRYQFQTDSGTNIVLSLLSRPDQSAGVRFRRIDYRVATNGLFRSVREVGWDEPQDLPSILQGDAELLCPAVGRMIVEVLLRDGTTQTQINTPSNNSTNRPVGVRVGLLLADAEIRKQRNLTIPQVTMTNGTPWMLISNEDERNGWKTSERIFRLP